METVSIEHFSSVEMVVGRIMSAERMDNSDKMLKLLVDTGGPSERTILSGIAQHYTPSSLVGRKCVVVTNLQPKDIMGVESNGMVLCASYTDGLDVESVRLIEPALGIPAGSRLS